MVCEHALVDERKLFRSVVIVCVTLADHDPVIKRLERNCQLVACDLLANLVKPEAGTVNDNHIRSLVLNDHVDELACHRRRKNNCSFELALNRLCLKRLCDILETESWRDSKSYLQELVQRLDGSTPTYKIMKEEGPDHDKIFTVGVFVGDHLKATGQGHSKQEAQVKAAGEAIRKYKKAGLDKKA